MMIHPRCLAVAVVLLLFPAHLIAQHRIERSVLAGGGTRANNSTHTLNATVGQTITGTVTSSTNTGVFGFWYNHTNIAVGVDRVIAPAPDAIQLDQNYPNPASTSTTVSFSIPKTLPVRLLLTDESGRTVREIASGVLEAGSYRAGLRVDDLPAGSYFLRLHAGGYAHAKRLTVLK